MSEKNNWVWLVYMEGGPSWTNYFGSEYDLNDILEAGIEALHLEKIAVVSETDLRDTWD